MSPGKLFWKALEKERPLQIVGTVNALTALIAKKYGFRALYISGAGVANTSYGLPDLAMTTLQDVCEDVRRITSASDLPVLVDVDTGWGDVFMIGRTIKEMINAGAAACHLEDQVDTKRCGHRSGKVLVTANEMTNRIKAATDGRTKNSFIIMARTDAHAVEGLQAAIERSQRYVEAGADMIFAEALTSLEEYKKFTDTISVPVLANITEFGKTPMFSIEELNKAGIRMALYPLSANRVMAAAAEKAYSTLRTEGTQKSILNDMQTRDELYDLIGYHKYEKKLDMLFSENKNKAEKKKGK